MASSKKDSQRLGKTPEIEAGGTTPFEQSPEIRASPITGVRRNENFAVDMNAFGALQQERSGHSPSTTDNHKGNLNVDIPKYVNPENEGAGFFLTGVQVQGS